MNPMWIAQMLMAQGVPAQTAMSMAFGMAGGGGYGAPGQSISPAQALIASAQTGMPLPYFQGATIAGAMPGQGLPPGGGANAGLGGIADMLATLYSGIQGNQMMMEPWNMQIQAAKTGMNPALLSQRINNMTQPLSQQLIKSVTRATTPQIAEQGLATSPGMSEQIIAEALAPYQLQEQQQGQNAALSGMNYPFQVGAGTAGEAPTANASMLNMLRNLSAYYGYNS